MKFNAGILAGILILLGLAGLLYAQRGAAPNSGSNGRSGDPVQVQTPLKDDVIAMEDALPSKAPAKPKQVRRVLVLAAANGYVHSSIPLAAAAIRELGEHTGAWKTDITYDRADINTVNLQKYDLIFLDNTTGAFLDDPKDQAVTTARRQALLDFVRNGKGIAGVHAAGDSYHGDVSSPKPQGTWPDFNHLMNGFFKFHWNYPELIMVKIDDPNNPVNAMFHGDEFTVHEEIYTFAQDSFSRKNAHILTSVDYTKMSDDDKAQEPAVNKRTDGDYGLSWIRREGKGRVFYEALGHSEHVYAMPKILEHFLAGIQYALGDLPADDSPSVK